MWYTTWYFTPSSKFNSEVENDFKTLPSIYWLRKTSKAPTGARFVVASRQLGRKALSKAVTKNFKLIFKQIQSSHENWHYCHDYKKVWVVENSKPRLDQVNTKKNAKLISDFEFSTPYTKLPHMLFDRTSVK